VGRRVLSAACRRSRWIIRYDNRDTGRSVTYEPGAPLYGFRDLVSDAIGLLDALGLASAHFVGISMGGAIAQVAALDHPDRVASLTLIATSPGRDGTDIPEMSEELRAHFARGAATPDWSDRTAVLDHMVEEQRPFVARSRPFDEAAAREIAARVVDRSTNIASSLTNHGIIEGSHRGVRGSERYARPRSCFMAARIRCSLSAVHSRSRARSPTHSCFASSRRATNCLGPSGTRSSLPSCGTRLTADAIA
jgi:pimeloyl-ACP methyl ester carboxylesterase